MSPPPLTSCDEGCRTTCERAVLARKARRVHNNFEICSTDGDTAWETECNARYGTPTSPVFDGPVVSLRFGVQDVDTGAATAPVRGISLAISTTGYTPLVPAIATGSPYLASSAIAFDRSPIVPAAGYRFLVSYTGDMVLDTTPQGTPAEAIVIR